MKKIVFIILSVFFLTSCAPFQVTSDYDQSTDFSKFQSFTIRTDDLKVNDIDKDRIIYEVERQLGLKGLRKSSNGDLVINITASYKSVKDVTAYTPNIGYGWGGRGGWGFGFGMSSTTYSENTYNRGTLIFDFVDISTDKLIWQGIGGGLNVDSPKSKQKQIPELIAEVLKKYPPGQRK